MRWASRAFQVFLNDQLETVDEPQPGLVALEVRKIGVAGSKVGNLESPGERSGEVFVSLQEQMWADKERMAYGGSVWGEILVANLGADKNVWGDYVGAANEDSKGIITQQPATHRQPNWRINEIELHKEFIWDHFLVDEECCGDGKVVIVPPRRWVGAAPFRVHGKGHSNRLGHRGARGKEVLEPHRRGMGTRGRRRSEPAPRSLPDHRGGRIVLRAPKQEEEGAA